MIKTFEQFINENYNVTPVLAIDEEYGAPLFNEVSESLVSGIRNSINEGRLVIDANMIEEGLFDTIGKLFKKGADKYADKVADTAADIETIKTAMETLLEDPRLDGAGDDIESFGKDINDALRDEKVYKKIEEFCKSAEDICADLAKKEEKLYKTISDKMNAANEAIKEFTQNAITKINEIVELANGKVSAAIAAVMMFCKRMAVVAKNALAKIGQGIVLAFSLPFVLAFVAYKGAVKVCGMLVDAAKDAAKAVKDAFNKVNNAIATWVKDMLAKAKEILKKACDDVKDGAQKAYQAVGNSFLAIVAVLGQLASDAKNAISEAYNDFVNSVKDFADGVKTFISEKWDAVSKWFKKTSTAFADGVKNVWDKMKEKVSAAAGAVGDAYKTLKDNAKATWEDIKNWPDEKGQDFCKGVLKFASDRWGKDMISSWMDEI